MRIVVPIKQVPETSSVKMDEATGTMVRQGVEAIVNPLDLYAIEAALQLREQHGGTITAISMGPPVAENALREAISMGVDDGVLISDRALAGSDTWATAYVLAKAIRKLGGVDLVLCGERATDGDTGQVGPGIASFLDLPVVAYVAAIAAAGGGAVQLKRLTEEGYETLAMKLPGLVTVLKETGAPRLPTLRGKQRAKRSDIPAWGVPELGADTAKLGLKGSPTRVVKIFRPTVARTCRKLVPANEKAIGNAVDTLLDELQSRELI